MTKPRDEVSIRSQIERHGYVAVRSPAASWIARPGCAGDLASGRADFLLAGRGRRHQSPGGGRGPLMFLDLGEQRVVAKRSLHGGLLANLLQDIYIGRGRVLAQAFAADRLRRVGISTPEVLAVGWRRLLGPLTTQVIVMSVISGARTLFQAARDGVLRERPEILEESARLVRALHDAGFLHGDLNLTNLVLGEMPGGAELHIIDLDRGRFLRPPCAAQRAANIARLLRSYEKWLAAAVPLGARGGLRFLRAYCGADRALLRPLWSHLRRSRTRLQLWRRVAKVLRGETGGPDAGRPPPE